jgi:hypothetical protein
MKKFVLLFVSFFFFNSGAALADHYGYKQKKLIENERVIVFIATLPPGAESPSVTRELDRVVYAVKGGTIQRNYDDGSTARYTYNTGDVVYADQPQDKQKYSIKNIGKSTVVLQVTHLKESD